MSRRVGIGAHAEPFVGGALGSAVPDLGPVDHPLVAVADRAGAQAGQVGAGVGLGVAEREDDLAPGDPGRNSFLFCSVPCRMIIGATEVTVRSGPGTPRVLELAHQQVLMHRGEAEAAVLRRPVQPEPALLADLAAERGQLAALVLETVLGHLGLQRRGDVLREELPHLGDPRALRVVELEVHAGDTIEKLSTYKSEPVSDGRAAREWPSPGSSSAP